MRVILVHGFNANPTMNFHPWLGDQLRDLGFQVVCPQLSLTISEEIDFNSIIEEMKSQIGYLKNDDVLVGHSLGGLVILQYLEAVEMTETPRAVVLVAPPWKVSRPELRRLFVADLDAEVLMWKAREFVVVHSKDDKLVPFEHGKKLAMLLKARLIETENDGHYMDAEYPNLLKVVQSIANTPFEYAPGMSLEDQYKDIPSPI